MKAKETLLSAVTNVLEDLDHACKLPHLVKHTGDNNKSSAVTEMDDRLATRVTGHVCIMYIHWKLLFYLIVVCILTTKSFSVDISLILFG